ncbi:MAG: C10 family peptidase [Candidatus Cloacimonetes bacterium]|nr:C10 family peptidase [Candidatus Cloacimonadota bacterium]
MKKLIILCIIVIVYLSAFAEIQSFSNISIVAKNFIESKSNEAQVLDSYPIISENYTTAYVFNLDPIGFVLVTTDDDLQPVIAYSFFNNLPESEREINPFFDIFIEDINNRQSYYQISNSDVEDNNQLWNKYLSGNIQERDFQQWPPDGTTYTSGWVETTWNQSGVYSQYCPLDNSGARSVVGCVATAMAMIVDFHKYVGNVSFNNSDDYYSGYYYPYIYIDNDHIEHDFPSFPELNILLDDVIANYNNSQPLTSSNKGALSFACGVSVDMSYSSEGSGTQTSRVASALLNKFDFSSAYHYDNNGASFYNTMKDNMKSMKPAEMSIYTSGWNNGHAIICDGYNTDDYYHLNFGWGTSNSSCWYLLPAGMPNDYSIVSGAVMNIEGGAIPLEVSGLVVTPGVSPIDTYITLEGDNFYESYVVDSNGTFDIPAVWAGIYTATAILNDRFYYDSHEVVITSTNPFIQFNLGTFDAVTGSVFAPVAVENTYINLYQDGEIKFSGIADENGNFSIAEVFPGNYIATASLSENYFESKEVEITADNQVINFDLIEYQGDIAFSFANTPTDIYSLLPNYTMSCAIKLTEEDFSGLADDCLARVRFIAPIEPDQGELFVQIWNEGDLLWEKEVTDFQKGDWIEETASFFNLCFPENSYYVGYKIHSLNGDFAYHDDGPRVAGKGAFIRMTGWTELPAVINDYNFCIEAIFISQDFGTISGNIQLSGGEGNILQTAIKAGNYVSHPTENGDYTFDLKADSYTISAFLNNYEATSNEDVAIISGETINGIDFLLTSTGADEPILNPVDNFFLKNYPNPFNPSTTISFSLPITEEEITELTIYNQKGQQIKEFEIRNLKLGINEIVWNGTDNNGKPVSSGIFLYRLKNGNYRDINKMVLIK